MMNKSYSGVIVFRTLSQLLLWKHELRGQFSDGMWENSRPYDHWRPWCDLEAEDGGRGPYIRFNVGRWPSKTKYNLAALIPIIGDRMCMIGLAARAAITDDQKLYELTRIEESEFNNKPVFLERIKKFLTPEEICRIMSVTYTLKDLRSDLKEIKELMQSAK